MVETLAQFKDLGIAGIAVVALAIICWKLIEYSKIIQTNYENFVQSNNHTTTELIVKATETMVETKNAIASHNELLKIMLEQKRNENK